MSGPINPILVVRNNLPEYKTEMLQALSVIYDRAHVIEDELRTIARLEAALLPPAADAAPEEIL